MLGLRMGREEEVREKPAGSALSSAAIGATSGRVLRCLRHAGAPIALLDTPSAGGVVGMREWEGGWCVEGGRWW